MCWYQIQSNDELLESLRQVKEASLIPEDKVRLCVIGDGVVKELFPQARQILDYYHLSGYLYDVAQDIVMIQRRGNIGLKRPLPGCSVERRIEVEIRCMVV